MWGSNTKTVEEPVEEDDEGTVEEHKEKEENVEIKVSKRGIKRKTENERRKAENGKKANRFNLNVAAEEVDYNGQ